MVLAYRHIKFCVTGVYLRHVTNTVFVVGGAAVILHLNVSRLLFLLREQFDRVVVENEIKI